MVLFKALEKGRKERKEKEEMEQEVREVKVELREVEVREQENIDDNRFVKEKIDSKCLIPINSI
jgi:superfamily I DNA and RNA helicase